MATSALCVTGLAVVDVGTTFNVFGQLVILALIQIGGLGIITFGTLFAFLLGRRINFSERVRLAQQVSAFEVGGVVRLIRQIFIFTFSAESDRHAAAGPALRAAGRLGTRPVSRRVSRGERLQQRGL